MGVKRIGLVVLAATIVAASCSAAEVAGPSPPAQAITRDQAIAIARAVGPAGRDYEILSAEAWRFGDVFPPSAVSHMKSAPPPDRLVWVVKLAEQPSPTGGQGDEVVIDSVDGRVISVSHWAS